MNPKVHIDAEIIKLLFFRYKDFVLSLGIAIISWLLFFQFVVPQIQNFLSVKDAIQANEQTLAVLSSNYNTIAAIDDTNMQQLTQTANAALPSSKDFAGILNTISFSAAASGVVVNDYSFAIGDLNSTTAQTQSDQLVSIALTLKGDTGQIKAFLLSLAQQMPLSEVTSVTLNGQSAGVTVNFFFSSLPKISFIDTNPLPPLTPAEKTLLQNLVQNAGTVISSPAASPSVQLSPAQNSSASSR